MTYLTWTISKSETGNWIITSPEGVVDGWFNTRKEAKAGIDLRIKLGKYLHQEPKTSK